MERTKTEVFQGDKAAPAQATLRPKMEDARQRVQKGQARRFYVSSSTPRSKSEEGAPQRGRRAHRARGPPPSTLEQIEPQLERRTYSVEEAARILGISRGTAYALARAGDLPVIRLGKRFLVVKAALDRMFEPEQQNASL